MEECGIVLKDFVATGFSSEPCTCLRPWGHEGRHVIRRADGMYISYELDKKCDCYMCRTEDPANWCVLYKLLTAREAEALISGKQEEPNP